MKYLLDTHVLLWALKGVNADNSEFPTEIWEFFSSVQFSRTYDKSIQEANQINNLYS